MSFNVKCNTVLGARVFLLDIAKLGPFDEQGIQH